jgi:hypothetical protein
MMHVAMSVALSTSTEGQAITPLVFVRPADQMIAELCGWEQDSLQWTELKIRTTTLTDPSQRADLLNHSQMIRGKVAKIRHETDSISYWVDGPSAFQWCDNKGWIDHGPV